MPQVQTVDLTPREPEPTGVQEFFSKLGKSYKDQADRVEIGALLDKYKQNRDDANAWEDLQLGLEASTISPSKRLETQKSLNEMRKLITERDKALNAKVNKGILTQEEKVRQKGNLIKAGYPEEIAEFYLDAPPGVQGILAREHKELVERGVRKPLVSVPKGVDQGQPGQEPAKGAVTVPDASSPTGERAVVGLGDETPQEVSAAKSEAPIPKNEWPELPQPENMTYSERVKWQNNNEKENSKLVKETTNKKHLLRNKDNRINIMTKINDSGKLPSGLGKMVYVDPDSGEIRPYAQLSDQINAETNLYIKNLNQYLEGVKEQLGSVVSDFDVRTFKSQLPNLLTNEQGRRLILKQMKYTSDLESIYNNTLNEALKKYGRNASYIDISSEVENKVQGKESDLIGKIDNLVEAAPHIERMAQNPDRFKGFALMQDPKGDFIYVPKEKVESLKKKKWRDF